MNPTPSARRHASWLVLIAFVFATLAPVFTGAGAGGSAARQLWIQLCNSPSPRLVSLDLPAQDDGGKAGHSASTSGHCLLCFHPATPPRLETPTFQAAFHSSVRLLVPGDPAPRRPPVWNHRLARAPPLPT